MSEDASSIEDGNVSNVSSCFVGVKTGTLNQLPDLFSHQLWQQGSVMILVTSYAKD